MKRLFSIILFFSILYPSVAQNVDAISGATQITISTGSNYVNEVYWGFENYDHSVTRSAWDIAFSTTQMSVSILANNGNEIMLYTYPNGTIQDWNMVDTTGIQWIPMYNSIEDWEMGAFMQNTIPGDQFDYGWGRYNMANHFINGDSIFIIKIAENDFRKLAIINKNAVQNQWNFKYAKLDGTNEQTVTINANNYNQYKFIHYSIKNQQIVEHEPNATNWQLLFTKYYDYTIPYYVTGVLAKPGVVVQEVKQAGLNQATFNAYNLELFSENISTIGSDWKSYNMGTNQYEIANDVVYFVKQLSNDDIWKIYFTGFSGSSTGQYKFKQEKLQPSYINNLKQTILIVYPNPAIAYINAIFDTNENCTISITDIFGRLFYTEELYNNHDINKKTININSYPQGIYNLLISNKNGTTATKFLKL